MYEEHGPDAALGQQASEARHLILPSQGIRRRPSDEFPIGHPLAWVGS
jgi:hypothetical protein